MARSIHIEFPASGYGRSSKGAQAAGNLFADVLVGLLAFIGRPVTRAGSAVARGYASWLAARRERREDEKLWAVALSDARVMADLSRAMSQDALRDSRGYF
jgi:hypothetical protein